MFKLASFAAYVEELGGRGLQALTTAATILAEQVALTINDEAEDDAIDASKAEDLNKTVEDDEAEDDAIDASKAEDLNKAVDDDGAENSNREGETKDVEPLDKDAENEENVKLSATKLRTGQSREPVDRYLSL